MGKEAVLVARAAKKVLKAIYKKTVAGTKGKVPREVKERVRKEVEETLARNARLREALRGTRARRLEREVFVKSGAQVFSGVRRGVGVPNRREFREWLDVVGGRLGAGRYRQRETLHGPMHTLTFEGNGIRLRISRHAGALSRAEFDDFMRGIARSKAMPDFLQELALLQKKVTWDDIVRIAKSEKFEHSEIRVLADFCERFRGQRRATTEINTALEGLRTRLAA